MTNMNQEAPKIQEKSKEKDQNKLKEKKTTWRNRDHSENGREFFERPIILRFEKMLSLKIE